MEIGKATIDLHFTSTGIQFLSYPFEPASIFPSGLLPLENVVEVDPFGGPPMVLSRSGDFLMIPAPRLADLRAWAISAGVPCIRRVDVWHLLLEPFIDTTYSLEHRQQTIRQLKAIGLTRSQIRSIRLRSALRMFAFNFIHWDWVHLGLDDYLHAMQPLRTRSRFRQIYWQAMKIARLGGKVLPDSGLFV